MPFEHCMNGGKIMLLTASAENKLQNTLKIRNIKA